MRCVRRMARRRRGCRCRSTPICAHAGRCCNGSSGGQCAGQLSTHCNGDGLICVSVASISSGRNARGWWIDGERASSNQHASADSIVSSRRIVAAQACPLVHHALHRIALQHRQCIALRLRNEEEKKKRRRPKALVAQPVTPLCSNFVDVWRAQHKCNSAENCAVLRSQCLSYRIAVSASTLS